MRRQDSSLTMIARIILGATLLTGAGCKDDAVTPDNALADEDAALLLAAAIGSGTSTAGLSSQIEDATIVLAGGALPKTGESTSPKLIILDTVVTRSRTGNYSYAYTFHLVFDLVNANTLAFTWDMRGTYDTPRLASDDSAHAGLIVSDLTTQTLKFNGTYLRLGSESFKNRENARVQTRMTSTLTDVTVAKATHRIIGGTMSVMLNGEGSGGAKFEVNATVTFAGNGLAEILVNGKTFTTDIATSEVVPH